MCWLRTVTFSIYNMSIVVSISNKNLLNGNWKSTYKIMTHTHTHTCSKIKFIRKFPLSQMDFNLIFIIFKNCYSWSSFPYSFYFHFLHLQIQWKYFWWHLVAFIDYHTHLYEVVRPSLVICSFTTYFFNEMYIYLVLYMFKWIIIKERTSNTTKALIAPFLDLMHYCLLPFPGGKQGIKSKAGAKKCCKENKTTDPPNGWLYFPFYNYRIGFVEKSIIEWNRITIIKKWGWGVSCILFYVT